MTNFLYTAPRKYPMDFATMSKAVVEHVKDGYIRTQTSADYCVVSRGNGDSVELKRNGSGSITARNLK